jgi:hypothetical protein
LYNLHCKRCHAGPDEGDIGPRLAKDWYSVRPDLTIKSTVLLGVPGSLMPSWGQEQGGPLAEQDVNDLVAYILTWSPEKDTPNSPAWASDPSPRWNSRLGLALLLAGPLLLGAFALVVAPKRQPPKRTRRQ